MLSRSYRHELTVLCVEEIRRELSRKPVDGRRSGRPKSPEAVLAEKLGVSQKSVHRWLDPEAVQADDANAETLCELALRYNSGKAKEIMMRCIASYTSQIGLWLNRRTPKMFVHVQVYNSIQDALNGIQKELTIYLQNGKEIGIVQFSIEYPFAELL